MHTQLVKLLEEVKHTQQEVKHTQQVHTKILNTLLKQKDVAVSILEPPEGAEFPLLTEEDVQSMNRKLCNAEFKTAVVSSNHLFTSPSLILSTFTVSLNLHLLVQYFQRNTQTERVFNSTDLWGEI